MPITCRLPLGTTSLSDLPVTLSAVLLLPLDSLGRSALPSDICTVTVWFVRIYAVLLVSIWMPLSLFCTSHVRLYSYSSPMRGLVDEEVAAETTPAHTETRHSALSASASPFFSFG